MLSDAAFREVQNQSTERLCQHLVQLQNAMHESNELHREQINSLQQMMQMGSPHSTNGFEFPELPRTLTALNRIPSPAQIPLVRGEARVPDFDGHVQPQATIDIPHRKSESSLHSHLDLDLPLQVERGHVLLWGSGFSGMRRVLDYDFDRLQAYAAFPCIFNKASIFRLRQSLLLQVLFQPLLMLGVACFVHYSKGSVSLASDAFHDTDYGKCLKFINDALQRLVPFVLGLFLSLQMRRWWTIRAQYLHRVHSCSMQVSMQLGLVLPGKIERFQLRVERYLLAAHKMIYMCAREKHIGVTHVKYASLLEGGVITDEELQHILESLKLAPEVLQGCIGACDMAVAGIPVVWAAQLIYRIYMFSKTPAAQRMNFDFPVNLMVSMVNQCIGIKKAIQDIEMQLTSPLPFPYAHLVSLVVHALAVFSCIEAGVFMGIDDSEWNSAHFFYHGAGVVILNSLYLGILCLSALLTNPFTDEITDFPAVNFHCRMRKSQIYSRQTFYSTTDVDREILEELGVVTGFSSCQTAGVRKKETDDDQVDDVEYDDDDDNDEQKGGGGNPEDDVM